MAPQVLAGHRILIVENEYILALDVIRTVSGAGAEVVGPFSTAETALRELKITKFSAAILNIELNDGLSYPIARALRQQGVPFMFLSGRAQHDIPLELQNAPYFDKPFVRNAMLNTLAEMVA